MVKALLGFRRKMARVGVDVPQGCEPAPGDRSSTSEATDLAARPPRNLDEALARMAEASRDDDWLGRNAAIQALPGLLEPLAAQPNALKKAMDALGEPMSRQLADLRSAIVRRRATRCVNSPSGMHARWRLWYRRCSSHGLLHDRPDR